MVSLPGCSGYDFYVWMARRYPELEDAMVARRNEERSTEYWHNCNEWCVKLGPEYKRAVVLWKLLGEPKT